MQQHGSKYFAHIPPSPDSLCEVKRSKSYFFQNMVIVHIKLKGMPNAATYKHIFCPYTHHQPLGGVKCQNIFPEVVMLHIKLMGMD